MTMPSFDSVLTIIGDYVKITPAGLIFVGRKDSQVKRFGKRFNLSEVEKVFDSFPEVLSCKAVPDNSCEPFQLYVFYIPTSDSHEKTRSFQETEEGHRLKFRLKNYLLEEAIPDYVFTATTFPVTHHGKLNTEDLKKQARKYLQESSIGGNLQADQIVEGYIEEMLHVVSGELDLSKSFIELGGNSFQAVNLVMQLERRFSKTDYDLLDCILHQSIGKVIDIVNQTAGEARLLASTDKSDEINTLSGTLSDSEHDINEKNHLCVQDKVYVKSTHTEGTHRKVEELKQIEPSEKRNSSFSLDQIKRRKVSQKDDFIINRSTVLRRGMAVAMGNNDSVVTQGMTDNVQLSFKENWSVDLEKCIDASPLVVKRERASCTVAYVGSHSGLFVAVDIETGKRLWQVRLPDRIESSACLSSSENLVVVGCYDHNVYFLDQTTGSFSWIFDTLGPVKSSPTSDPDNGLVYVGSHDGNLYALQPATKECQWSVGDGGGSMFSSPCVDSLNGSVYAASLLGKLLCVSKDTGELKWSYQCPKPLFSSPAVAAGGVVLGCIDGRIYNLNHSGKLVHSISTEAPIFSSPCLVTYGNSKIILIGSHDGHVYRIDLANGNTTWKTKIGRHVYSTPSCIFKNIDNQCASKVKNISENENWKASNSQTSWEETSTYIGNGLVCCCSTNGTLVILDLTSGKMLASRPLPGEIFSSPLFMEDGRIIFGCRDNKMYSISLDTG